MMVTGEIAIAAPKEQELCQTLRQKDRNQTILWRARFNEERHRWGADFGKTLRYNRQRQRWIRPPLSLSLFLPIAHKEFLSLLYG